MEERRRKTREIAVRQPGQFWSFAEEQAATKARHEKEVADLHHTRMRQGDRHVAAVKRDYPLPASERGDTNDPVTTVYVNAGI